MAMKLASRTFIGVRTLGTRNFGAIAESADYPDYITGAPAAVLETGSTGLKIASITTPGKTATVTAWIQAGSRYESPSTTGVASLFGASAIAAKAAEIKAIGGKVTTKTSREHIIFEAKVLEENVPAATKLLGQMATVVPDISGAKKCMVDYLEKMGPEDYEKVGLLYIRCCMQ